MDNTVRYLGVDIEDGNSMSALLSLGPSWRPRAYQRQNGKLLSGGEHKAACHAELRRFPGLSTTQGEKRDIC
jgi:hypothetical protein